MLMKKDITIKRARSNFLNSKIGWELELFELLAFKDKVNHLENYIKLKLMCKYGDFKADFT